MESMKSINDWQSTWFGVPRQLLLIELIKPMENLYALMQTGKFMPTSPNKPVLLVK